LKVKLILPSLAEASTPLWRPIKYSLFPPLGLATLAALLSANDDVLLVDQHVQTLTLDDRPDLVLIQVYVTNAYRAYAIADHYRRIGSHVALGGLHVTSMPDEAAMHADTIFLGPAEGVFPDFLEDFRSGKAKPRYVGSTRNLLGLPPARRDLIDRSGYLVPNSLVVSRGCPHHCSFCYKDAFFAGGKSFYTQHVDEALAQIAELPGQHLYFLDDHLLGSPRFARSLFDGMRGMGRLFQGAATVDSLIHGDLVERAVDAGLRSIFVGFETLSPASLRQGRKKQNLEQDYAPAVRRMHDLGVKINGSFVFGFDDDDPEVFRRTVAWGVGQGLTTATYHVLTPYPGTALFDDFMRAGRIESFDWSSYDTRQVVFKPMGMAAEELKAGYDWAYQEFYRWRNIAAASAQQTGVEKRLKQFVYTAAWKKLEPVWRVLINSGALNRVLPMLESVLNTHSSHTPAVTVAPGNGDGEAIPDTVFPVKVHSRAQTNLQGHAN
jgi:radical SAM superfamily enzyme YgiQ (UPF0313 family)